eukprot:1406268-Prymnesium_polylepis.1
MAARRDPTFGRPPSITTPRSPAWSLETGGLRCGPPTYGYAVGRCRPATTVRHVDASVASVCSLPVTRAERRSLAAQ